MSLPATSAIPAWLTREVVEWFADRYGPQRFSAWLMALTAAPEPFELGRRSGMASVSQDLSSLLRAVEARNPGRTTTTIGGLF